MKRIVAIAGIVIATLCALGIRVALEGKQALAAGDAALSAKRTTEAIAAWETAARWYLPGAPHVDDAYTRLVSVARADEAHALAAWRAVRRAALATRSLWTPHADDLAVANAEIARRSAADPEGAVAGGPDVATREAWHAARLAADLRPGGFATALAILGILCLLAGIGVVVRRGVTDHGRLVRRPALVGAILTVVGLVGWAAGLYNV